MSLDDQSIRRAILHLSELGDTDIFPSPFEFIFFEEKCDDIVECLSKLDISKHTTTSAFECLSPKGRLSFRIAHQLFPVDTLLYTSATIQIAPLIEAKKLPVENGPFSYRFVEDDGDARLFLRSSNFHDWLLHLKDVFQNKGAFSDAKYVLETDISDFYSRIYFHRVEHVLDDCGAPNQVRKIIEKVIKETRVNQTHGLPVGSAASRIIAEGILIDTDQMIAASASGYSRYVDDFRVLVDHQAQVHSLLCNLAEHLMLTEGLSLNASKTKSYTNEDGVKNIDSKMTDVFTEDEIQNLNLYMAVVYDDEDVSVEEVENVDPNNLMEKLRKALIPVDYTAIKLILKVLRAVKIEDAVEWFEEFSELLYHTPRDFCLLIGGLAQRYPEKSDQLASKMVETIRNAPFRDMALSRIWVAHLFVTQALPITEKLRLDMSLSATVIEQRQDLLLRGLLSDRAYFRAQKTKFDEANDWAKPALMLGASCLSTSEYKTWLGNIKGHVKNPTDDVFRKWLVDNQPDLFSKLKVDYVVKTLEEQISELFESEEEDFPF